MAESEKHAELINRIYDTISPYFERILIEKRNVGLIQVFDKRQLNAGEKRIFKIANADILVLDEEKKPLLVIEPETGSSPKTFGRSIPIYTIARNITIRDKEYPVESPLLLLIVIPDQSNGGQKDKQLPDLEAKLKKTIDLEKSNLKDFGICQVGGLKKTLEELFKNNGYEKYGEYFK